MTQARTETSLQSPNLEAANRYNEIGRNRRRTHRLGVHGSGRMGAVWLALLLALAGCAAIGGGDSVAILDTDLTIYAMEADSIRAAATAEQIAVVETVVAAGTRMAQVSAINAALGATVRAHQTGTPAVQAVVVSADDMASPREGATVNESGGTPLAAAMSVSNLATAASTDPDSGCSSGAVSEFSPGAPAVYVTARVTALRAGALFEVEWLSDGRTLASASWLADYSKSFECVWFYATPTDFPFAPGVYAATLFVDGAPLGATEFTIANP